MLTARRHRSWGKTSRSIHDRDGIAVMASNQTSKPAGWLMTRLERHPLLIGSGLILTLAITVTFVVGVLTGGRSPSRGPGADSDSSDPSLVRSGVGEVWGAITQPSL